MKNLKEFVLNGTKKYLTYTKIMVTAIFIVLAAILCVMCCKKETAPSEQPADLSQKQIEKESELPVAQPVIEKKSPSVVQPVRIKQPVAEKKPQPVVKAPDPELPDEHNISCGGKVLLKMIKLAGGTFMMGSPESEAERHLSEKQESVTISDEFYIGIYEVTQNQYQIIMGENPSDYKGGNHPVTYVSWDKAMMFCDKLNASGYALAGWKFTLPTSAQWEYACRAGTSSPFSWGDSLNGLEANCAGNLPYGTATQGPYIRRMKEVGCYAPNAWGLYDMHGNVWEWCLDFSKVQGKNTMVRDVRGGAWGTPAKLCRSAVRYTYDPFKSNQMLGFRVVMVRAE